MSESSGSQQAEPSYVLGHSEQELARLEEQARLIGGMTRRFFEAAGIRPGMRVLDVGSGAGDVSLLVAELVGEKGEVVGVDRVPAALEAARNRVKERSLRNVSFVESDLATMTFDRPFDAAVGRYVLMFQADPAAILKRVASQARAGGVVVFHEVDWRGAWSQPAAPLYDRCCAWLRASMGKGGADVGMAGGFGACFSAAGLPSPSMLVDNLIGAGETASGAVDLVVGLVSTLQDEIVAASPATISEIGIETLRERMLAEVIANRSVVVGRSEVGAWARVS
jgi:SAM-dependent methyltransferase